MAVIKYPSKQYPARHSVSIDLQDHNPSHYRIERRVKGKQKKTFYAVTNRETLQGVLNYFYSLLNYDRIHYEYRVVHLEYKAPKTIECSIPSAQNKLSVNYELSRAHIVGYYPARYGETSIIAIWKDSMERDLLDSANM